MDINIDKLDKLDLSYLATQIEEFLLSVRWGENTINKEQHNELLKLHKEVSDKYNSLLNNKTTI